MARVVVMVLATLASIIVALVFKPSAEEPKLAQSGHVVVLLDKQSISASVQVAEGSKPSYGIQAPKSAAKSTTYISLEVQTPIELASHRAYDSKAYQWGLLLEDFPRLTFPRDTGPGAVSTLVKEVHGKPGTTPFSDEVKSNDGTHSYILMQSTKNAFAAFTFGAPNLALRLGDGYADVSIPPVEAHGVLLARGPDVLDDITAPTRSYSDAPANPPQFPVIPSNVQNLLDFPPSIDADNYALVAGVEPTARNGSEWQWDNQEPHVLLRNTNTQNQDERHVFVSGIWWGVAGAAGIALLLEVVEVLASLSKGIKSRSSA